MKDTRIKLNESEQPIWDDMASINATLKDWGLYKYELARACGVHRTTITGWEHEPLTTERAIILSNALTQLIKAKQKTLSKAFV